jgi:hypothetical protein
VATHVRLAKRGGVDQLRSRDLAEPCTSGRLSLYDARQLHART